MPSVFEPRAKRIYRYLGNDVLGKVHALYSLKFHLTDERVDHKKVYRNLVDVLVQVGGLSGSIFGILKVFGTFVNRQLFMSKLINALYFIKMDTTKKVDDKNLKKKLLSHTVGSKYNLITFTYRDKFAGILRNCKNLLCPCCKESPIKIS